jgi:peptidoglycan/LPS O-acetylase OafA/YrhL
MPTQQWIRFLGMVSDPAVGLAAFVLVNRTLQSQANGTVARRLREVGIFSYSLYLTHVPLKFAFDHWFGSSPSPAYVLLRFAVVIPLCILFARGFFELFEKPLLNRRARIVEVRTAA